jgi:hypothetical protein
MINSKIEEYIYFLNDQNNYFDRIIPNFKIDFLKFDKIIDPGSFETLLSTNVFYKNSKNEIMSLDIIIYESDFLEWLSEERLNKINQILDNDDRS